MIEQRAIVAESHPALDRNRPLMETHVTLAAELASRRPLHAADRLNAEDTREPDAGGVALAGEQFGAVHAERLDADQHLAGPRRLE